MDKNRLVIYQINPRMFTQEGTLRSAKRMLPHLASVGVNTVYLFSICQADASKDKRFWSKRQKASNQKIEKTARYCLYSAKVKKRLWEKYRNRFQTLENLGKI